MRQFLLKTLIVTAAIYILFQFTIGYRFDEITSKINFLSNQHERIQIKQKILDEMKKGTKKDNIFSEEDRVILSNFINKIILELNLSENKD
tara:strand:+ start:259 stop:531 length:273 start_codon:yes stop_codon:yes gene_type:complete